MWGALVSFLLFVINTTIYGMYNDHAARAHGVEVLMNLFSITSALGLLVDTLLRRINNIEIYCQVRIRAMTYLNYFVLLFQVVNAYRFSN